MSSPSKSDIKNLVSALGKDGVSPRVLAQATRSDVKHVERQLRDLDRDGEVIVTFRWNNATKGFDMKAHRHSVDAGQMKNQRKQAAFMNAKAGRRGRPRIFR